MAWFSLSGPDTENKRVQVLKAAQMNPEPEQNSACKPATGI